MADKISCFLRMKKGFIENVAVEKTDTAVSSCGNVNGNAGAAHCVYIPIDSSYGYFEFFSQLRCGGLSFVQ